MTPVLRGATAIASHIGIPARRFDHLHRGRLIPTFRVPHDSSPQATVGGLDEWMALESTRKLIG